MSEPLHPLVEQLVERRKDLGLEQQDIARRLFRSRSSISQIENGHRGQNSLEVVERYAAAVGLRLTLVPKGER